MRVGQSRIGPNWAFLGYAPKRVYVPEAHGVRWSPPVVEICSVAGCISEGASPEAGDAYFDFNRARFYATPEAAVASMEPAHRDSSEVFAYSLCLVRMGVDGQWEVCSEDDLLAEGPSLPTSGPLPEYRPIGFDVGAYDVEWGWGCSPLSCNGLDGEFSVNRFCLLDDLQDALRCCLWCQQNQPEPGDYRVVQVLRNVRGS